MSIASAGAFCQRIKSRIFHPVDEEANKKMYDVVSPFHVECKPKTHSTSFMWLGVTDKVKEGYWQDLEVRKRNESAFYGC